MKNLLKLCAMNKDQIIDNFKTWVLLQLDSISTNSPLLGLCKPVIVRVINNNITKANNFLSLLSDANGNIDIENILTEMLESIMTTNPFIINTELLGDVVIGGGKVRFTLPFINKELLFNTEDLRSFKELVTVNTQEHG